DVPPEKIEEAIGYVLRCHDNGSGAFKYQPYGPPTVPCTGTSLLCLEVCGKNWHGTAQGKRAGDFILSHPPTYGSSHFYYSTYYCTQATFQLGTAKKTGDQPGAGQSRDYWKEFKKYIQPTLLNHQNANGSWSGGDAGGSNFGANYCTPMAVLALAVEY